MNYPVVGVSWYEAYAYTQWLSAELGQVIQLPTEQQWQRAAQGDDGRKYPWGDRADKTRCNVEESAIGRATPVTKYVEGASPYDVLNMAGNVGEWCLNDWETGSQNVNGTNTRIIRGSSFIYNIRYARTTSRSYYLPDARDFDIGFRLCAFSI